MREVNLLKASISILLVLFLHVPASHGRLSPNDYGIVRCPHPSIVQTIYTQGHSNRHIPSQLNSKQRENRSEKSAHRSMPCIIRASLREMIYHFEHSTVVCFQKPETTFTKVPIYLSQHSLLI